MSPSVFPIRLLTLLPFAFPLQAQLAFHPDTPPSSATPPTELYHHYTGTHSHQKGPKTVMVFLVRPSDGAAWTNPPSFASLDNSLDGSSQRYYDASYRQTWFGPKHRNGMDIPRLVVTPVLTLPQTRGVYYNSFSTLQSDCIATARAQGGDWENGPLDPYNFDRWVVLSNSGLHPSTGLAYVGGRFASTGGLSGNVALHEWGHNWGLFHANSWFVPEGEPPRSAAGDSGEYGDGWDVMGGGDAMFNPLFQEILGFLERARGEALDVTSGGTYRIYDYVHSDQRRPESLTRALILPMSSFTDPKRVVLGFGHWGGADGGSGMGSWNRNAVSVHSKLSSGSNRVDTTPGSRQSDDRADSSIKIGRTYSEGPTVNGTQLYGGFHVTPVERGSTLVNGMEHEWIDVVIHYQNELGPNQPPSAPTLSSAGATSQMDGTTVYHADLNTPLSLTAAATDPDGDPLAWDWVYGHNETMGYNIVNSPQQAPVYSVPGLYQLTVAATDMKGGVSESVHWINAGGLPVHPAVTADTLEGLAYRYYEASFTSLPDFTPVFPVKTGVVQGVSLSPRERNDDFAFVFEGYLDVPASDVYQFYVRADDGAVLEVAGVTVVDNDGAKNAALEVIGGIQLEAGLHPVRLSYYHKSGTETLELAWSTLTMPRTPVPDAAFRRADPGANADPAVTLLTPLDGDGFVVNSDIQLTASALDADGINRVYYFANGSLLGSSADAGSDYAVTWSNVSAGSATVVAVAYDATGRLGKSAEAHIEVSAPETRNSIGLNLGAVDDNSRVFAGEAVGAYYATANWNNSNSAKQTDFIVLDHTGTDVGARVDWDGAGAGSGTFGTLGDTGTGAGRLMRGGIQRRNDVEPQSLPHPYARFRNIPYLEYDVYVYFDLPYSNSEDDTIQRFELTPVIGDPQVRFGRNSLQDGDLLGDYPTYDTWIGFREATATSLSDSDGALAGNYVVFRGVVGSEFIIESTRSTGEMESTIGRKRRFFNAVQIVEAPVMVPRVVLTRPVGAGPAVENGAGTGYWLRLSRTPDAPVTVTVLPGDQLTSTPAELVFTPADWDQPRNVSLAAVDDSVVEGPHSATVTHTVTATGLYAGVTDASPLTVDIADDDVPSVSVFAARAAREASGSPPGRFSVVRVDQPSLEESLAVEFHLQGAAGFGDDYTLSGASVSYDAITGAGTFVIPAGASRVFLEVIPAHDTVPEGPEAVILALQPGAAYNLAEASDQLAILDDDVRDYFTEFFESGAPYDLDGVSLTFTPDGDNYTVSGTRVESFPSGTSGFSSFNQNALTGGNKDDGHWALPLAAPFPFFGVSRSTAYVGTNGHISFASDSYNDLGTNLYSHFQIGRPRISVVAFDLDPGDGGSVQHRRIIAGADTRTVISYNAVRNDGSTAVVNAQAELFDDGRIRLIWLDSATTGMFMAGLSSGVSATMPTQPYWPGGNPNPFYESDFSAYASDGINQPPAFTSAPPPAGAAGVPYSHAVHAADPDGDSLALSLVSGPVWLSVTDQGGGHAVLSGTPPAAGGPAVTLRVDDGEIQVDRNHTLTILPAGGNTAPAFTSTPDANASAGSPYLGTVAASDPDGQPLSFRIESAPSWLSLTDHGDGTATLSGTIPADALDSNALLSVTDGIDTTAWYVRMRINQPPAVFILHPAPTLIRLPEAGPARLRLRGAATDESGVPTTVWSRVSGPGAVDFGDPAALETDVAFDTEGLHRIRLTADDGEAAGFDERVVLVGGDPQTTLGDGLLGHWEFNEGAGNVAADLSGNGNDATVSGLVWAPGVEGTAAVSTSSTFTYAQADIPEPGVVTVAGWMRLDILPNSSNRTWWTFKDGGGNNRLRVYQQNGTRRLRVFSDRGSDGIWECLHEFSAGVWTHVAVSYDNTSLSNSPRMTVNGAEREMRVVSAPSGSPVYGSSTFRMGDTWPGAFDAMRVYDRELTPVEIRMAMHAGAVNSAPRIELPAGLNAIQGLDQDLGGQVSDDGLPADPGEVESLWSVRTGPGDPVFENETAPGGAAVFSIPGTYLLRISATDGALEVFRELEVAVSPAIVPGDGNGNQIPDQWETDHFGRLLESGETIGKRGREVPAYTVYVWGVDPGDPDAVLEAVEAGPRDGTFRFRFPSVTGRLYDVSRGGDLSDPDGWIDLEGYTDLPGSGALIEVIDAAPGENTFYRVRVRVP